LKDFESELSMELTYMQWLEDQLNECCIAVISEYLSQNDETRLEESSENKLAYLADLYILEGGDLEELDYQQDKHDEFLEQRDLENVDEISTGIQILDYYPAECDILQPGMDD